MAYDAGMMRFVLAEAGELLCDGKVEKIYEPQSGEIVIRIKKDGTYSLLLSVLSSVPRICVTADKTENPANPPMFCMLLRKHLGGGRLTSVTQLGFERAARFGFDVYDEMGYAAKRYLIVEIMGKYSNIILLDGEERIISATRTVDLTENNHRLIMPGMKYELPPAQDKSDLTACTDAEIAKTVLSADGGMKASKFITSAFLGISAGNASELVFDACGDEDALVSDCREALAPVLVRMREVLLHLDGVPCLVRGGDGKPVDYSFIMQKRYGEGFTLEVCDSYSALVDSYFSDKAKAERLKKSGADVSHLLDTVIKRIERKNAAQTEELLAAEDGERYRLWGDLITANIYRLKRGMTEAQLEDYNTETYETVTVPLDSRLTPAANAQKYYKKYTKAKTAREVLTAQLEASARELEYLYTVYDALTRADGERELEEIRYELRTSGYVSRTKGQKDRRAPAPTVLRFTTSGGRELLCGKNNLANDHVTFRLADRDDWWFHVKNMPGSHVVMRCAADEEPDASEFTEAAALAAAYSKAADSDSVAVDYTRVRYVKKPPRSNPGYVTYSKNWTAYVTPKKL